MFSKKSQQATFCQFCISLNNLIGIAIPAIIIFGNVDSYCQTKVVVLDFATKKPIPSATVLLTITNIIMRTSNDGSVSLLEKKIFLIPYKSHMLVISQKNSR